MVQRKASSLTPLPRSAGIPTLLGATGGLLFLFVFPKGSITTLMHEVLHLPGPGAGIALILGPVALFFILIASRSVGENPGGGLLASLAFSVTYGIGAKVLNLATSEKGAFGSIRFIIAMAVCGVTSEIVFLLTRRQRALWRFILTALGANTVLLTFYWIAIFPRTRGWVTWDDVPLLIILALVGGAVAGVAGSLVWTRIRSLTGSVSRRQSDVWTR